MGASLLAFAIINIIIQCPSGCACFGPDHGRTRNFGNEILGFFQEVLLKNYVLCT